MSNKIRHILCKHFIMLPFALAWLGGAVFSCAPSARQASPSTSMDKAAAVRIAVSYLKQLPSGDDYILENPMVTPSDDGKKNWLVVFKHVQWQTVRPGRAIIMVDRITGTPKWITAR